MSTPVVVLAGGVGAARYLRGVVRAVAPEDVTVVVNTGDDRAFYGVHVSPDLDIVTYTLANRIDPERGFGLADDTYRLVDRLAELGHEAWFRLGDADYANCLHRTLRLAEGAGLDEVTDELRRDLGLTLRLLPMSNDPCPTRVELCGGTSIHFEEYLVRDGAPTDVEAVDLSAARAASPHRASSKRSLRRRPFSSARATRSSRSDRSSRCPGSAKPSTPLRRPSWPSRRS